MLLEAIILSVIAASTPLLLAATGELVVERSGVLNLGVEGMMIVGAACGFAGAYMSGSTVVGALCGILAGAALATIFGILTLGLAVNQVATGLALTILGVGLSGLIGKGFVGEKIVLVQHLNLPFLTDLPVVGRILFGEDPFVYVSIALIIGIWLFLYRTRAGLVLRAVGDNHASAHALGYPGTQDPHAGGAVRRRLRRARRRLPAARLYAVFHPRHDRGARVDRLGAGGVCIVAAAAAGRRCLSVRRGQHPAAPYPGARARRAPAVDVGPALSCHRDRSRVDFTDARYCRVRGACVLGCSLRA
jgi:hypothetical protein